MAVTTVAATQRGSLTSAAIYEAPQGLTLDQLGFAPTVSHTSNVEWRRILADFRAGYQSLDPAEILVIELVANSLDAGARRVVLTSATDGEATTLCTADDGAGMRSREEFESYHDLGSLTKQRGSTIGWAGIGAKLYLDRCDFVYTETKSSKFAGASVWSFPSELKAPTWEDVPPRGKVIGKTGTTVEVTSSRATDRLIFRRDAIEPLLRRNYNYALRPLGGTELVIDGTLLEPFNPGLTSKQSEEVSLKLRDGSQAKGVFYILSEPAPAGFELISLVVNGKVIGEQYDFKQLARIRDLERIAGYVRCDGLVHIVTTSKDGFNRKSATWIDFSKKVGERFSKWLERNGALLKLERDEDFEALASEIGKDLNKVFALPEIRLLGIDLFQLFGQRRTAIQTPEGEQVGAITDGMQTTTGTVGGEGLGGGVPTEGDEAGPGVRADMEGDRSITERTRRTRGGVKIAYGNQPDRPERAWIDPGLRAILINKANPAFVCADGLGSVAFYTAECCFAIVTEQIERAEEREATINKLFRAFAQVAA